MQQNIGLLDRYIRLVGGIAALTGSFQLKRNSLAKTTMMAVGAMKVAEGVTGWCPVMHACGIRTTPDQISAPNGASRQSGQSNQHHQSDDMQNSSNHRHSSSEGSSHDRHGSSDASDGPHNRHASSDASGSSQHRHDSSDTSDGTHNRHGSSHSSGQSESNTPRFADRAASSRHGDRETSDAVNSSYQ